MTFSRRTARPASPPFCPPHPRRTKQKPKRTPMRFGADQEKEWVELRGLEPLTSSMPWKRATNCAKAPRCFSGRTPSSYPPRRPRDTSAAARKSGNCFESFMSRQGVVGLDPPVDAGAVPVDAYPRTVGQPTHQPPGLEWEPDEAAGPHAAREPVGGHHHRGAVLCRLGDFGE